MVAHDDDDDDGCALADQDACYSQADQGAGCSPTVDDAGCGNDDVSVDESSGVVGRCTGDGESERHGCNVTRNWFDCKNL